MKNLRLILSFTIVLAMTMYSCKKEKGVDIPSPETDVSTSQQIMNRINAFKEKMNNDYKSGSNTHIDTAVWDLEALISYENAYPDSSSRNFTTYESYYTLKVDVDSLASDSDIEDVYDLMLDSVAYHLTLITSTMKFLVFSDVELVGIVDSTATIKATNGYGFNLVLGWYTPIDDDWIWGFDQGNCSGTDLTSDGSDELQYRINNPQVQLPGAGSYTDYETLEVTAGTVVDEIGDYTRIYWDDTYTYSKCIYLSELTVFLTKAHDIIYLHDDPLTNDYVEGVRPDGKDFISIEIEDSVSVPEGGPVFVHYYKITYAKPFVNPN